MPCEWSVVFPRGSSACQPSFCYAFVVNRLASLRLNEQHLCGRGYLVLVQRCNTEGRHAKYKSKPSHGSKQVNKKRKISAQAKKLVL